MKHLSFFVVLTVTFFTFQVGRSDEGKDHDGYTVCTATVNSPEERETFKQHLKGKNFKFVELTEYSEAKTKDERESERIVQARYGALGASFKDRMRRVFSGIPHIYGFDSVGPSGKTVKPFLDRYFKRVPDYENHLLEIETRNLVQLIEKTNLAAWTHF